MKPLIYLFIIILINGCGDPYPKERILYEGRKVAMPKEYRRMTGYDSIQVVYYRPGSMLSNGWEGHFCYPNELEFEKWKYDSTAPQQTIYTIPRWTSKIIVDSIEFRYDSIIVLKYNRAEIKEK